MKNVIQMMCVVVVVAALGSGASAVDIETVPVGNVGNSADTRYDASGYGAVAYEYNIGKYEVTAGQYCAFLNAVAKSDPYGLYNASMDSYYRGCQITQNGSDGSYTYDFSGRPSGTEADWSNRPVNLVTWGDSARFANWLHNGQPDGAQDDSTTEDGAYDLSDTHAYYGSGGEVTDDSGLVNALQTVRRESDWKWAIPTEDEWYKAAYYNPATSSYYDYPTGSNSEPSNALNGGGNNATFEDGGDTVGSPYYRSEVGAHENSDSPYGTFDQGGNVWEWNEAINGRYRAWRGGAYNHDVNSLPASYRREMTPTFNVHNFGFRVTQVPEPATLSLMTFGGLALVRRRRNC